MQSVLRDRSRRWLLAGSLSILVVGAVLLTTALGSSSAAQSPEPALGKLDAKFWSQLVQNL